MLLYPLTTHSEDGSFPTGWVSCSRLGVFITLRYSTPSEKFLARFVPKNGYKQKRSQRNSSNAKKSPILFWDKGKSGCNLRHKIIIDRKRRDQRKEEGLHHVHKNLNTQTQLNYTPHTTHTRWTNILTSHYRRVVGSSSTTKKVNCLYIITRMVKKSSRYGIHSSSCLRT